MNDDQRLLVSLLPILAAAAAFLSVNTGTAAESQTAAPAKEIAEGGRLYDKWWGEYNLKEPDTTHPLYPETGKKKGAATWRCKECHGWDYKGRDGAYGSGSHYTGTKGVNAYAGRPPEEIFHIIEGPPHGYGDVMLDGALRLIATFVSEGQIDMDAYIDRSSKKVDGDAANGGEIYDNTCARCHGADGRDMNFKAGGDEEEYVGTVAQSNPWEAFHKIRNGHPGAQMWHRQMHSHPDIHRRHQEGLIRPGERMPYMREALTLEEQAALVAYLQTLPAE